MKKLYFVIIVFTIFSTSAFSQKSKKTIYKHSELHRIVQMIKEDYIPDKRTKIYEIEVDQNKAKPTLTGVVSDTIAYNELIKKSKETYGDTFVNNITLLPSKDLEGKTYGVINLSVADIRARGEFSAEMATQAILGTPVRFLQKDGWCRIQTPDGYIGWTQLATFQLMTEDEFVIWTDAPKLIFTDYFGFAYLNADKEGQTVSDLVAGNMLRLEGEEDDFYKVLYPDGRMAYVLKTQSKTFDEWQTSINLTGESLVRKSFEAMGIPYVWGGTSVKGMDCSGFTKMILFLHGVILTRDASQQALTGTPVDISKGYENLQIGDLMFFGKKAENGNKERIRHVAFYIGNNEFIHASGCIRIGSLDPNNPNYDELNTKEFIRASRVTDAVGTEGIWALKNHPMYRCRNK